MPTQADSWISGITWAKTRGTPGVVMTGVSAKSAWKKGLMMPAFPEITRAEAEAAWKWLEAVGTRGLKPYAGR